MRETIPYVLDLLAREPDLRRSCIEALQAMHADEAAPHVAALLGESDADMKLVILGCLEALDEPGFETVAERLSDHHDDAGLQPFPKTDQPAAEQLGGHRRGGRGERRVDADRNGRYVGHERVLN